MCNSIVFIIGAPRSGTTWLRKLLSAQPSIVAPTETHLFSWFLGPMDAHWKEQSARLNTILSERQQGKPLPEIVAGLPTVLTENDFYELCSAFLKRVETRCLEAKPTASLVIEKTPQHVQYVPLIERLTEGTARYIHVIRHGYEVVDSLLAASEDWGARWAPREPLRAAARWRDDVRKGRSAADLGGRYTELYFEDLRRDHGATLQQISSFLGVDVVAEAADVDGTLALGDMAGAFGTEVPEPPRFQRGRHEPRAVAVYATERVAGDLLDELGYERRHLNDVTNLRLSTTLFLSRNYRRAARFPRMLGRDG